MDIIATVGVSLVIILLIAVLLVSILGRMSDPEPRDSRIDGPGIPIEITDEELDAILRKHGLL